MPYYEYGCRSCGHEQEEKHSITEEPVIKCSECGKRMVRNISGMGFVLKGDGWTGRDIREKRQRAKRAISQQKKMEEHSGDMRVRRSQTQET